MNDIKILELVYIVLYVKDVCSCVTCNVTSELSNSGSLLCCGNVDLTSPRLRIGEQRVGLEDQHQYRIIHSNFLHTFYSYTK